MEFSLNLLPCALSDVIVQAYTKRELTQADRYGLMAAILEQNLTEEEQHAIDRLIHSYYRGRLKLTDELSVIDGE
ncbi:hypothetical protein PJF56_10725 [Roseofilum sp. BLCC_M91]|uniref:Uncharacterized protein n=1 Tax=Roseofilum halophilum BLCC-M91 TaxID=3022259 RepID=A0ABT7BJI0_9CYAN|nr:hypothetical protein [Roseofilum halophilum]MDJ1179338.1 hypothetical protein [Roseofilum halophilum BLCC-M91]